MLKLTESLTRIEKQILRKEFLFLGLDYDGTLTPIVDHPDQALLSPDTRSLLRSLRNLPKVLVCIISGRSYQDLKMKVDIKGIVYAGNHGMEIKSKELSFTIKNLKKHVEEINKICRNLNQRLKEIEGVWVENKGLTAGVHYRLANSVEVQKAKQVILSVMETFKDLKLRRGKKVWEIRPNIDWDKGRAVAYILKKCLTEEWKRKTAVVYIGDDQTDEDVFSLLKDDGITALVCRRLSGDSNAQYFLTQGQVIRFLGWLGNLWEEKDVKS